MRIGNRVGRGWIIGPALAGVVLMVSGCGGEDGAKGANGQDGADGTSCTVAEDNNGVATITCGDDSAEVSDGETGPRGPEVRSVRRVRRVNRERRAIPATRASLVKTV